MYCNSISDLRLELLWVENCNATGNGGGIYVGAPYTSGGFPAGMEIDRVYLTENSAVGNGGGVYQKQESVLRMANCRFQENTAGSAGGGFYVGKESFFVSVNCLAFDNTAAQGGGVYLALKDDETENTEQYDLRHWTITRNTANAPTFGSGLQISDSEGGPSAFVRIVNSIIWGNDTNGVDLFREGSGVGHANDYNDIGTVGGPWTVGPFDISTNPIFKSPAANNFRLTNNVFPPLTSPCIDAAHKDLTQSATWPWPYDFADVSDINDQVFTHPLVVDFDLARRDLDLAGVPNVGPLTTVDMGAFETLGVAVPEQ